MPTMTNPNWKRDHRTGARRRYEDNQWKWRETGVPVVRMTRGGDSKMHPAPFDAGSSTKNRALPAGAPKDVPAFARRVARRRRRSTLAKASRRANRS